MKKKSKEFFGYVQAVLAGVFAGNSSQSPANVASLAVSVALEVERQLEIQLKAMERQNGDKG